VIELYAITDHPGPPLPEVAPLRAVGTDGLAVVCGPATDGEVSADRLWRHEEVVEALMDDRDLLPVRYGTLLDDEVAAIRILEEHHDRFATALDGVRGAVELSVRVLGAPGVSLEAEVERPRDGAEYLRAKVRTSAERDEAARVVHEPLAMLARESRKRGSGSGELLRAAYLVSRDQVDSMVRQVARVQLENPRLRVLCTGPWPPYSFADRR
jgi:hypothetical protein